MIAANYHCGAVQIELDRSPTTVNERMLAREVVAAARLRTFDGADTWAYVD